MPDNQTLQFSLEIGVDLVLNIIYKIGLETKIVAVQRFFLFCLNSTRGTIIIIIIINFHAHNSFLQIFSFKFILRNRSQLNAPKMHE